MRADGAPRGTRTCLESGANARLANRGAAGAYPAMRELRRAPHRRRCGLSVRARGANAVIQVSLKIPLPARGPKGSEQRGIWQTTHYRSRFDSRDVLAKLDDTVGINQRG